jgi:hypothetical protein
MGRGIAKDLTKFGNRKTVVDGETFDSRKEARRYAELKLLERAGEVRNIQRQVPFVLIPAQLDERGRVIENPARYIADFVYNDRAGRLIVEDVKGYKQGTAYAVFVLKRKLMLKVHGIRVTEV